LTRAAGTLVAALGLSLLASCDSLGPKNEATFAAPTSSANQESDALTRARLHTELAAAYFELGNMAVALEELKIALGADPTYAPAYNVAGLVYTELRDDRLAQENFQRALRLNPTDSDTNNNYGRFLCERRREDEAIKYFMAALKNPLYQTPDRSYVNAGLCARRKGDLAAAEDYFMKAVKLRPAQPQALYYLAEIAYSRRDFAQAKQYLGMLGQVAQPTAETLWLAIRVERRLGDRAAAASYGTQLARNFPNSKEAQALNSGREE